MSKQPTNGVPSRHQAGFTLIELMISLLLGLLVVAAAGGIFLSNRRVYGSTEAVNRIQENQRVSFEIMARDIREAGGNPCSRNIVNMLDTSKPGGNYWTQWMQGVNGVEGGAAPDQLTLFLANGAGVTVTSSENPSANIGVSQQAGFQRDDIAMVCNPEMAAIFQITQINSAGGLSFQHNSGSGNPGNLQKPFQIDQETFDRNPAGNAAGYCFLPDPVSPNTNCLNRASGLPAQVVRPYGVRWFIQNNGRGGTSLYRQQVVNSVNGTAEEIAEGVTDMQIQYRQDGAVTLADAGAWTAAQWQGVNAIRVVLTLQATQGAMGRNDVRGTDNQVLTRTLDEIVTLRNRVDIQ